MAIEIERRFLVERAAWQAALSTMQHPHKAHIRQGYVADSAAFTCRIRLAHDEHQPLTATLTLKGNRAGTTRPEFEYAIPIDDGEALFAACPWQLEKYRYTVTHAGNAWCVDVFLGDNAPLVIAEIEFASEAQSFARPAWLGAEITERAYSNRALAERPYQTWSACKRPE